MKLPHPLEKELARLAYARAQAQYPLQRQRLHAAAAQLLKDGRSVDEIVTQLTAETVRQQVR